MLAGLLGLTTINNVFSENNNPTIYQNVIENKNDKTKTISLYEGENDTNLKPIKQYTIRYGANETPIEKIIYKWSHKNRKWIETDKYEYIYSEAGGLKSMTHSQWSEKDGIWYADNDFDMLLLDVDKELLAINKNY